MRGEELFRLFRISALLANVWPTARSCAAGTVVQACVCGVRRCVWRQVSFFVLGWRWKEIGASRYIKGVCAENARLL